MSLTVYSKRHCPFCERAKAFLKMKNVAYEEILIDLPENAQAKEFVLSAGHKSVPQIYQDGELFVDGGYTGLVSLTDEDFKSKLKENHVNQ